MTLCSALVTTAQVSGNLCRPSLELTSQSARVAYSLNDHETVVLVESNRAGTSVAKRHLILSKIQSIANAKLPSASKGVEALCVIYELK